VTLPDPGVPDTAATAEYWKAIADAAVELAKAEVAAEQADKTWERQQRADLRKAEEDEYISRRKDEAAADLDIHKQVLVAMIEVAKGSIERSRDSAKFVQASAAALATAYTTLLAIVFSIKDHPLPPRGFIPTIFLGLATALATAYLAFLTHPQNTKVPPPSNLPRENAVRRLVLLVRWTGASVHNRARFLRAAVVALLFGVLFLPVAVISGPSSAAPSPPAASASASPAALGSTSPSTIPTPSWPAVPSGSPDAFAVELYKAQLAAHVASLTAPATTGPIASTNDSGVEIIAWLLFVVGLAAVYWFSREPTRTELQSPSTSRPGPAGSGSNEPATAAREAERGSHDDAPPENRAVDRS